MAQSVPGATAMISRPAMAKPSLRCPRSELVMSSRDTVWSENASATAFAPSGFVLFPTPTKISLPDGKETGCFTYLFTLTFSKPQWQHVLGTPYNHAPCHFMQSNAHKDLFAWGKGNRLFSFFLSFHFFKTTMTAHSVYTIQPCTMSLHAKPQV